MELSDDQAASPPAHGFRIVTLPPTLATLGLVLSELSRHPPFSQLDLKLAHDAVRYQLRYGLNAAALDERGKLLGYLGWARTLSSQAELWLEDRAALKVVSKGHDAVALTMVVSSDSGITRALIRHGRRINKGLRVYFKRSYSGTTQSERKNSVIV